MTIMKLKSFVLVAALLSSSLSLAAGTPSGKLTFALKTAGQPIAIEQMSRLLRFTVSSTRHSNLRN